MTLTPDQTGTDRTIPDDRRVRPGVWAQLRPLVLRLHFYAGVLVAPFILVAAATGLLYTITPQLEQVVYSDQLQVEPGAAPLPMSEQVAAARAAHPDGDLVAIRPSAAEDGSTRIMFTDASVREGYDMAVFVDPYEARVLGEVPVYGRWLGIRATIDDLHRNLLLGDTGRHYSELAASWLWVVVLGGLALWFTRRRRDRRLRRLLLPERGAAGRRRTLSWHATLGVWVALGALLLSASGLTWSRFAGANVDELRTAMDWQAHTVSTSLDGTDDHDAGHSHHGGSGGATDDVVGAGVGVDGALAAARAAGLRPPLVLTPPADASSAWTVAEHRSQWPTQADSVAVDPAGGQVVDTQRFADQPLMAKLARWVIDAHMGILFGVVNQLVLAGIALALIAGVLLGYRSWWRRRPTRGDARVGRPPVRGTWRRLSWPVRVGVVVTTVAVGWFVPLLGLSLAVFLVVDLAVGAWQARRAGAARGADAVDRELPVG